MADFYAFHQSFPDHHARNDWLRQTGQGWHKDGCQIVRVTTDPEGYPAGVYFEGWVDRFADQGGFDFPMVAA